MLLHHTTKKPTFISCVECDRRMSLVTEKSYRWILLMSWVGHYTLVPSSAIIIFKQRKTKSEITIYILKHFINAVKLTQRRFHSTMESNTFYRISYFMVYFEQMEAEAKRQKARKMAYKPTIPFKNKHKNLFLNLS